jgi:hypothetical protein
LKKLVVVEEAFVVGSASRGVLVDPKFTLENPRRDRFTVKLVMPDGTEREAQATLDIPHVRGAHGAFAMVRLYGVVPEDVPRGTEIFEIG